MRAAYVRGARFETSGCGTFWGSGPLGSSGFLVAGPSLDKIERFVRAAYLQHSGSCIEQLCDFCVAIPARPILHGFHQVLLWLAVQECRFLSEGRSVSFHVSRQISKRPSEASERRAAVYTSYVAHHALDSLGQFCDLLPALVGPFSGDLHIGCAVWTSANDHSVCQSDQTFGRPGKTHFAIIVRRKVSDELRSGRSEKRGKRLVNLPSLFQKPKSFIELSVAIRPEPHGRSRKVFALLCHARSLLSPLHRGAVYRTRTHPRPS